MGIHTCRRRDTLPGAIGAKGPCQVVICKENIEHLVDSELEIGVGDRSQGLHTAVEVSWHQVG